MRGGRESAKVFVVWSAGDAALGEDGGDVARRCDVEGRMRGVNVRRDAHSLKVRDFGGGAFFDGNVFAIRDGKIKGGNRRGDVEGDAIFFREDGNLIRAHFVCGVAGLGKAVGAGDGGATLSGFHKAAGPVVR